MSESDTDVDTAKIEFKKVINLQIHVMSMSIMLNLVKRHKKGEA